MMNSLSTVRNGTDPIRHEPRASADQRAGVKTCTPHGCSIELVKNPKKADKPATPPCLVNMLMDPGHPQYFQITGEMLECPSGAPGSFLDVFKTHVRDTVGTEAFLRALGNVTEAQLSDMMKKALVLQGHDAGVAADKAHAMACAVTSAGIVLLENRVAGMVKAKLELVASIADVIEKDETLQGEMLAQLCQLNDEKAQVELLACFGMDSDEALEIAGMLSPFIPQEIKSPTADSKSPVAEAKKMLGKGLSSVSKQAHRLLSDLETWQMSKNLDMLADFGPEVEKVFADLGLPSPSNGKDTAMGKAVDVHVDSVKKGRAIETSVKLLMSAATSLMSPGWIASTAMALAGAAPGIVADGQRSDDLELLGALGSASAESQAQAEKDLATDMIMLCVNLVSGVI